MKKGRGRNEDRERGREMEGGREGWREGRVCPSYFTLYPQGVRNQAPPVTMGEQKPCHPPNGKLHSLYSSVVWCAYSYSVCVHTVKHMCAHHQSPITTVHSSPQQLSNLLLSLYVGPKFSQYSGIFCTYNILSGFIQGGQGAFPPPPPPPRPPIRSQSPSSKSHGNCPPPKFRI